LSFNFFIPKVTTTIKGTSDNSVWDCLIRAVKSSAAAKIIVQCPESGANLVGMKQPNAEKSILHECTRPGGYALIEVMVIVAIIGTFSLIAVPTFRVYAEKSRTARAIGDIRTLEKEILSYYADNYRFPASLDNIRRQNFLDPWGTPYQYLRITVGKGKKGLGGTVSDARKDKFLVPINSDYDLYSMGPDKKTQRPLTSKAGRDDIVRANNGTFVGPANLF
jgi:general secretion pathway protein G